MYLMGHVFILMTGYVGASYAATTAEISFPQKPATCSSLFWFSRLMKQPCQVMEINKQLSLAKLFTEHPVQNGREQKSKNKLERLAGRIILRSIFQLLSRCHIYMLLLAESL